MKILAILATLVLAGCGAVCCVTERSTIGGGDGVLPNLFAGERWCGGYRCRGCTGENPPVECNCDRGCACWESDSHVYRKAR